MSCSSKQYCLKEEFDLPLDGVALVRRSDDLDYCDSNSEFAQRNLLNLFESPDNADDPTTVSFALFVSVFEMIDSLRDDDGKLIDARCATLSFADRRL